MYSLILQIAARNLLPILVIYSILILLRGHNAPGGGFIGGLLAAAGFILYAIAFGVEATGTNRFNLDSLDLVFETLKRGGV